MSWLPKKNVVVPVDFSDASLAAVDEARKLVGPSSDLHVVHVLPPISSTDPGVVWGTVDDQSRIAHAEKALSEKLAQPGLGDTHLHVTIGDPGQEIVGYAEGVKSELIVIASHGRTGLSRLLLGSVAERVLRMASCPVLVLRS